MGGSPDSKMRVTQYSASIHYGICHGPVDDISRILVQEKEAWTGTQSAQGSITIRQKELFGGTKKEGGVEGLAEYLPGGPTQTIPEILAAKAGRTTATMPAYRGIASLWFYGRNLIEPDAEHSPGFYWGANNPYLPGVWVTVSRTSEGLGGGNARIGADSNGAHIIYECLTNTSWGMGSPASAIDVLSFTRAAATLAGESFGLSMIWTRQTTIEAFVSEVLDHIEAVLFVSPRTGLLTLKLIRAPYVRHSIHFALDRSTSMAGDRLATLKAAMSSVLDIISARLAAGDFSADILISTFGPTEQMSSALAATPADITTLKSFVNGLTANASNTDFEVAANRAAAWFGATSSDVSIRQRVFVLVTDGEPTAAGWPGVTSEETAAAAAAAMADLLSRDGGTFNEAAGTAVDCYGVNINLTNTTYTAYLDNTPVDGVPVVTSTDHSGLTDIILDAINIEYPTFTPLNANVTKFGRKLWGETVNEIVATWTNPASEEEETVVAQDLANIEMQGGIVSDSRNYYGVRNSALAMRLAQRDLRAAATPLASCDIEVNREAWDLEPGDVCILESPEDGIDSIVMRVGPVDYGTPGDATIRASLVEDVWSLALADYTDPPETEAEDTSEIPTPADYTLILTASYWSVVNGTTISIEYPEVIAGVLATEDGPDTIDFDLYGEVVDAGGNTTVEDIGTKTIASRSELPDALIAEVETIILDFGTRTRGNGPTVGGFVLLEGADETEHELCLIISVGDSPISWTLRRGVLDTIPRAWPAGTPAWFIDESSIWLDQTIRAAGETVDYQILPRTSRGQLALGDAPIVSETLTGRPHLPLRPAGVTIDLDDGFSGLVDVSGVDPIPVTWARRNRLTEDTLILAWDDGDVTPEVGQTTTVRLTDIDDNVVHEYTGIAGTSQNVDPADFGDLSQGYILVTAVRDGLESLQPYKVHVILSYAFEFEDGDVFEFEDGQNKAFEDL